MPAERDPTSIESLREAVRRRVNEGSLRQVADDTGVSVGALWRFTREIEPTKRPHPKTLQKLRMWRMRVRETGQGEGLPDDVRTALSVCVRHLPPAERATARVELIRFMRQLTRARGARLPQWLR